MSKVLSSCLSMRKIAVIYFTVVASVLIVQAYAHQVYVSENRTLMSQSSANDGRLTPLNLNRLPKDAYHEGKIHIKFSPDGRNILQNDRIIAEGFFAITSHTTLDALNERYRVTEYRSLLYGLYGISPNSVANRRRHKDYGLHLWYELTFDGSFSIQEVVKSFNDLDIIDIAEPVFKKRLIEPIDYQIIDQESSPTRWSPNDPLYADHQWSLNNTGQVINETPGLVGADINAENAWNIEKGHSDVIVAVFDNGVDFRHNDLSGNMWENIGPQGTDTQYANHGTHVAGTVAAVTNNNVGIAGIAGGSGTADGVRIMAINNINGGINYFQGKVYAADNGAAISQNSWGYGNPDYYNVSDYEAIEYFNDNGGGEVLNGGITIFAAGNTNSSGRWYPAYFDHTIAVASTDNRDRKSSFSNYGDWIDISAPGSNIISCRINNAYSTGSGTSMACPHVSGVAALIASFAHRHRYNLSNAELKHILLDYSDDIHDHNPGFINRLGAGRVNAYRSLLGLYEDYFPEYGKPTVAVNPSPANNAVDVSLNLEELSWDYIVDTLFIEPIGFRVYMNTTGQFNDEDDFDWIPLAENQQRYSTSDIMPDLQIGMRYYWQVVPTTIDPDGDGRGKQKRRRRADIVRTIHELPMHERGDAANVPVWSFTTEVELVSVSGRVIGNDAPDGIAGASVYLSNLTDSFQVDSGADGNFQFDNVPGGAAGIEYDLIVASRGYQTHSSIRAVTTQPLNMGNVIINEIAWRPYSLVTEEDPDQEIINLFWEPAEALDGTEQWIHWDSGSNHNSVGTDSEAQFIVVQRFTAQQLSEADVTGLYVSAISFYPFVADASYTVKVYRGGSADPLSPGEELVSQEVDQFTNRRWNEVQLDNPVRILPDRELWFGYHVNTPGGYPVGSDEGPAVNNFGNVIFFNNRWQTLLDLNNNLNVNWNLQAYAGFDRADRSDRNLRIVRNRIPLRNNPPHPYRELEGYQIFRFNIADEAEPQEWTFLAEITDTLYADSLWSEAGGGHFKYAVRGVYTNDVFSEDAISDSLFRVSNNPAIAVNPFPEDDSFSVALNIEALRWDYIVDSTTVNPLGFRLYFGNEPEFGEDDDFEWVEYVQDRVQYSNSDILTDLQGAATYYWQVIPTTINPNDDRSGRVRRYSQHHPRQSLLSSRGDAENCPVWSFTTVAAIPYTEDFEAHNNWQFADGDETNKWYVGEATAQTGNKSAYISDDEGLNNIYNVNTASIVHLYRDIDFPATPIGFDLTFWWKAGGEGNAPNHLDYMQVHLVDRDIVPSAGEAIAEGIVGQVYSLQEDWAHESIPLDAEDFSNTSKRLIFSWINNDNLGEQPPVAIDNISITHTRLPSPDVSIAFLDNEVIISWNRIDYANAYKIFAADFMSPNDDDWELIATVNETEYRQETEDYPARFFRVVAFIEP